MPVTSSPQGATLILIRKVLSLSLYKYYSCWNTWSPQFSCILKNLKLMFRVWVYFKPNFSNFLFENQKGFLKALPLPSLSPEEYGLLEHNVSLLMRLLLLLESWQLIINTILQNIFKKISSQFIQYSPKVTRRSYIIPCLQPSRYDTFVGFVARTCLCFYIINILQF